MSKGNVSFDRLFKYRIGPIFGLLTFLIGLLGYVIALVLTPDYIMWQNSISMLTLLTGGIILRIGMVVSNFLAIPYMISLGRALKDDNVNEFIRKFAIASGIFSSISVILTGVFTGTNPLIRDLHGMFAMFSWFGGAITCLIFGFLMLKNSNFTKFIAIFNFLIGGIFATYLLPFFITIFCSYFCYSFGQMVYMILPTWEWSLIFSILLWYFFNSFYLLREKP